jgi:beta-propeller repeat-containing protein
MHRWFSRSLAALGLVCLGTIFSSSAASHAVRKAGPDDGFGGTPLAFEPNRGQADSSVEYVALGRGYRIHLTADSTVITTKGKYASSGNWGMRFVGASATTRLSPEERLASLSNYFIGTALSSLTDIPNFAAVRRNEVYPGIDVIYYGNQQRLEYDFIVKPGAEPEAIRVLFDGLDDIVVNEGGDLILRRGSDALLQQRPHVYQEVDGKRVQVAASYKVDGFQVAIKLGDYDRAWPLVIDPVIAYGSGEGGSSESYGIAVDGAGNAYVAGYVIDSSVAFPLVSAYDTRIGRGEMDAYVQKFNPSGTALIYSTYIGGGTGWDQAAGIAVDAAGNAYVTGTTNAGDFPVTASPYQPASAGGGSFIFKLAPQGNALVYSTYLLNATATGIAVDSSGNAHVTGTANGAFTTTPGVVQPTSHSASGNPFVFKLNTAGSSALYSTFLGGSGTDNAYGIALDATGNAYIAGSTTSADFPTVNAYRSTSAGGKDAFVAKIGSTGAELKYATYLGGGLNDYATAIAVDSRGSAYVTGNTESFDFPVLNAFQPTKGGVGVQGIVDNAFVTKLSPGGNDLDYSSFLGGSGCIGGGGGGCLLSPPIDIGKSIAVDAQGNAYVGGQTQSISFPRVDSLQGAIDSNGDAAFVVKVSKTGGTLLYSTLLGGTSGIGNPTDWVTALAADNAGNVYGTGTITAFPKTPGPYQSNAGAVVFKLSSGSTSLALASSVNPTIGGQNSTLTATVVGGTLNGDVLFVDGAALLGSATLANGVATLTRSFATGIHGVTAIYRDAAKTIEIESPLVYQVTNPAAVCN